MAEYIDKRALLNEIAELHMKHKLPDNEEMLFTESDIRGLVACLPTAEVVPVRNGQRRRTGRILDGFIEVQCSECEETHLFDMIRLETAARYCPYCGVKWDGGADNG